jgi:8-oxo-dGTP diphosphatase
MQHRRLKRFDEYPRPSVEVDVVCLTVEAQQLCVLLYEREADPQVGSFALPGGFVQLDESLESAAARLLRDKAGLSRVFLEQLFTFGEVTRDPRGRVVTVAYVALIDAARFGKATARKLQVRVPWPSKTGGPVEVLDAGRKVSLFLDHALIVGEAVKRLRGKLDSTPVGFQLLPEQFTLRELKDVHEVVLGEEHNKDSFRRRMLASDQLEATGAFERDVLHRPAELYRLVRRSAL